MRLVDADAIEKQAYDDVHCHAELEDLEFDVVTHYLDHATTIDAVPVVRCKDCKHWKPSGSEAGCCFEDMEPIGGCRWVNFCRKASDFCSYGERKDGEG